MIPLLAAALIERRACRPTRGPRFGIVPAIAALRHRGCEQANAMVESQFPAGVAQLVRARGSYPRCPGFKSLHRHHLRPRRGLRLTRVPPGTTTLSCPSRRALRTIRKHGMLPPADACARRAVGRPGLGRAAPRAAELERARPPRRRRRRPFQSSAARRARRMPTSSSAASWRLGSACRSWSGAATCAALARGERPLDRGCRRARRATRF